MPAVPPGCDPESIVLTFSVAREHAGLRLDRFLQIKIPRLSRTRANAIVKACAHHPDGRRRRASERVRAGETVMIIRPPMDEPPTPQFYKVLYEDEDVLVVDKPSGLPMHPTATYHRNTLSHLLAEDFGDHPPQFAHRLDRETSGIVVCAKHRAGEIEMKKAFERREVGKRYLAIVRGDLQPSEGTIDAPMASADEGPHVCMAVHEDGVPAVTEYRVLERKPGAALIDLHPETGRQHQLRVHLAHRGCPIIGDKLYGPDRHQPFLDLIEEGWTDATLKRLGHPRHALHAAHLEILHPRTGALLSVDAPLPWDLQQLWENPAAALDGAAVCQPEDLLVHPAVRTEA